MAKQHTSNNRSVGRPRSTGAAASEIFARVPAELKRKAEAQATKEDRSLSSLVRIALAEYLRRA